VGGGSDSWIGRACSRVGEDYNPYDVVGSDLHNDILAAGQLAVQEVVRDLMSLFGTGRA
jgi:hypothetical protein